MTYLQWVVVVFGLLLSACSTRSTQEANSPASIYWQRDPETLDPLALPTPQAIEAASLLQIGLLQLNLQNGIYCPALAEQLPTNRLRGDSLSELDYRLRPQATWDDGRPITANDVAFTLKLMHCPGLPNEGARMQLSFVKEYRLYATDPQRITIVCQGYAPEYVWATGDFPILSEAAIDSAHVLRRFTLAALRHPSSQVATQLAAFAQHYQQLDAAHRPERMGSGGPYRLVQWRPNQMLLFERKPLWWADKLPQVPDVLQTRAKQLRFVIMPNEAAAALALQRRELDVLGNVSPPTFRRLQRTAAGQHELTFYTRPSYNVAYAAFNTKRPALGNATTRQALSHLFDGAALIQATQLGQGTRTASLLPPSSPFYYDSLPPLTYAPDSAARLLRQAGWRYSPDGWHRRGAAEALRLVLCYRADDNMYATIALQFQAAAKQLGITVELRPTESSRLSHTIQAGDFDIVLRVLKGSPFSYNFSPLLHSKAPVLNNMMRFGTPETDRLLLAIATEEEPIRKRRLLYRLQTMLRQQAPLVPLFFLPYHLVASRRLQPFTVSGLKPNYNPATLSWATADSVVASR